MATSQFKCATTYTSSLQSVGSAGQSRRLWNLSGTSFSRSLNSLDRKDTNLTYDISIVGGRRRGTGTDNSTSNERDEIREVRGHLILSDNYHGTSRMDARLLVLPQA